MKIKDALFDHPVFFLPLRKCSWSHFSCQVEKVKDSVEQIPSKHRGGKIMHEEGRRQRQVFLQGSKDVHEDRSSFNRVCVCIQRLTAVIKECPQMIRNGKSKGRRKRERKVLIVGGNESSIQKNLSVENFCPVWIDYHLACWFSQSKLRTFPSKSMVTSQKSFLLLLWLLPEWLLPTEESSCHGKPRDHVTQTSREHKWIHSYWWKQKVTICRWFLHIH